MNNTYELRGHLLREHQLFRRTYTFERKRHTAIYFIEQGKVFSVTEEGSPSRCNFGLAFLERAPTVNIEPLDEFFTANPKVVEEVGGDE